MGLPVPLRTDYRVADIRRIAKRCRDNRQIRRLLALAAVYDGINLLETARVVEMNFQTLRDWVHQFNEYGPDCLTNAKGAERPRLLNDNQMQELAHIVETGPDYKLDGVVHWRRLDLIGVLADRFGVECSERSMSNYLARLGFSNISGRPQYPAQDGQVAASRPFRN